MEEREEGQRNPEVWRGKPAPLSNVLPICDEKAATVEKDNNNDN